MIDPNVRAFMVQLLNYFQQLANGNFQPDDVVQDAEEAGEWFDFLNDTVADIFDNADYMEANLQNLDEEEWQSIAEGARDDWSEFYTNLNNLSDLFAADGDAASASQVKKMSEQLADVQAYLRKHTRDEGGEAQ